MASRLAFTLLVATLACVVGLAVAGDPHLGSLEYSFYDSGGAQLTADTEVDLPAALSLDEQYTFVVVVPQATVAIEQVALVFVGVVDTAIAGDVVSGELIPFASGTDVATISLTVTDTNDGETQEYVVVFMRNFGVIENLPIGLNSDMEANVMVSLVDNYAAAGFDPLDLDLDALAGIVASLTRVVGSGTLDVSLLGMFEIFDLAVALVVAADDLSLFPNLAEVGAGLASQLNEVMNDGDSVTCDDCYGGESHFVLGKFDSMVASKVLCNAPGGLGTGSDLCIDFGTTFPTTATSVLVTLIMAPPAGPIDGDDDLADNLDTFSSYLVNLYDGDTGDAIVVNSGASINQAFTNPMVAGVPNEVTDTAPATGFISTFSAGYFDGDDAKDNGVSDVTCDDAASTCSFDATHLTGFFVAVDACASYSLCGTCTAQPECGWCNSANLCATGDASGPTEGGSFCPGNWDFDDCECVNQVEVADGTNPSELSAVVGPIDFVVTMDPADVEYPLNIQVEAEYLRDKTTYVIDFTEFATDGSRTLREPGVCENRRFRDFQNFPSTWWESAPAPGSEGALGTTTYRAYPPSIAHEDDETTPVWTISSVDAVGLGCNGGLTASPRVTYSGDFSLSDLSKCTHANGNSAVNVNADPLGWHVEAELFVKAIQDNEATTDNDEDVVAVATSGGGLLSDSVVIDVYGFKCHHEEDGLVGTAVEDPLTGDFYCMCESGYGNSLYLDSPVCHLKVAANCLPGDPDRLNADIYEGSVDGSTLTVSVRVPIVAGRRVTSISYGGDPTGLRPECNYPGPTWVHTHRTVGCYDIFTMTLDTNSLLGCGVERVYTESEPEGLFVAPGARREVREDGATISQYVSYSADVTVTIEDDIEVETSVGTEIQTRVTNNNLRFVTAYPAQYVISTTAEFTSDHSLEALIVGQQWDFLNNVAIINLATLVRFPYKLTAMTATLTVEGTSIPLDPSTDPSSCPDGEGEVACLQDWEITIVPEIACRVTGVYNFAVTLGCRDEPDTADFLTACVADEASLVVDLQADDICNLAFLDESNGVVADLVTYTSETYTVETAAYFLGEFIYGEARVSSSSWSLESVDFSFATLIFKDDVLPDAVALDAEEGDQIFNPDGSISRRFRAYLTSQVAPQLTQGVTEDYTLWATVTVGYQDGSKRRAEVRAIQGLKPSTTLSITGTAAAAVGPEGTGGLASTVSAPTIALGVAGAALVVVIVVAVVFKLRSGPGSTKGKDLEGAGVSSTAVSSTSGASSTGGAGSSTEEYYYYYQDDVRRGDKANDASSTSASTSAASVSEFGMF